MAEKRDFEQLGNLIGAFAKNAFIETLQIQGHTLTGKLGASIRYEVEKANLGGRIRFYAEGYALPLEYGTKANRIPYDPTKRTGAKTSQYIQGLIEYAILRMRVGTDEAKNIAFAIARKHKIEGNPTQNSSKYSQTGERTNFIQNSLKKIAGFVRAELAKYVREVFVFLFRNEIGRIVNE